MKFGYRGGAMVHEKIHTARGHQITQKESEMIHICKYCSIWRLQTIIDTYLQMSLTAIYYITIIILFNVHTLLY